MLIRINEGRRFRVHVIDFSINELFLITNLIFVKPISAKLPFLDAAALGLLT